MEDRMIEDGEARGVEHGENDSVPEVRTLSLDVEER